MSESLTHARARGNALFQQAAYADALDVYTSALQLLPQRAAAAAAADAAADDDAIALCSNAAMCCLKLAKYPQVFTPCSYHRNPLVTQLTRPKASAYAPSQLQGINPR